VDLGSETGSVPKATMKTYDADIVVTTRKMTSLRVWQASNDYVCLTAANASLFVDSNCEEVCDFIQPDDRYAESAL
jgi:hypothetical protein